MEFNRFSHFDDTRRTFFEGWYFKHTTDKGVFSFIPGVSVSAAGTVNPFVQVITDNASIYKEYHRRDFYADKKDLLVVIGGNVFSRHFVKVDIDDRNQRIKAKINYGEFTEIPKSRFAPTIMGPFSYFPLKCNHGIISVRHHAWGEIEINGETIGFSDDNAYIETDWGRSFPKAYFWVHCGDFPENVTFMASVALVPFGFLAFKGAIGVLCIEGKQIVLATYLGARSKVISYNGKTTVRIKQGRFDVFITVPAVTGGQPLKSPIMGEMKGIIREKTNAKIRLKVHENGVPVFDSIGENASVEMVNLEHL